MLFHFLGYWVDNELIEIPAQKIDLKGFKEAHVCTLEKMKPLAPPITQLEASFASFKPFIMSMNKQSS